jgi:hypothetical protein
LAQSSSVGGLVILIVGTTGSRKIIAVVRAAARTTL